MNKKFFILIFFLAIFLVLPSAFASAAGLVPCGGSSDPCTLCHLIVGFQKLTEYALKIVIVVALTGIFIAGAMYMVSTGDTGMIETAKRFMGASLIGFTLTLCAWLIVNVVLNVLPVASNLGVGKTNWYTFKCDTKSTQGSQGSKERTTAEQFRDNFNEPMEETTESVKCGDGNRGVCLKNPSGPALFCASGWIPLGGGDNCKGVGAICCIKEEDTIKERNGQKYYSCGAGGEGICMNTTSRRDPCEAPGYSPLGGGNDCHIKGWLNMLNPVGPFTACCKEDNPQNDDPLAETVNCGHDSLGTCKSGSLMCPSDWEAWGGEEGDTKCSSGQKCCVFKKSNLFDSDGFRRCGKSLNGRCKISTCWDGEIPEAEGGNYCDSFNQKCCKDN